MSFPYADRPMWLYSRSSDKHLKVLFQQMQNLLDEAERRAYTVAGTSQDMGSGKSMARMGLKQMMRAVKDAALQRLRPILMTSFATVLGLIPLAFASGEGANQRIAMGTAVCGGMIVSTLLTMYIVPAIYSYISTDRSKLKQE